MYEMTGNNRLEMERLNALFEHSTEAILIVNQEGIIEKANPSSERIFGYNSGELLHKSVETLIPDKFKKTHSSHRDGFMKNPHSRPMGKGMTLFAKKKDGTELPVEISLSHYKTGDKVFAIAFIIDISERIRSEEEIKRVNLELERKVDERTRVLKETLNELEASKSELQEALNKEKELNDMKSRFVTMASHEFRTPLSTILSSVSLISKYKDAEEDDKRMRHVDRIKSAVTNMTMILNDFLSAGKLEEGKVTSNPVNLNIVETTQEITSELINLLKPGQKIEYMHKGDKEALLDKQFLRNILINLISNAIKFSSEKKSIYVNTSISGGEFKLSVKDEGLGIPDDEKKNLFERFFRAKNVSNIQGTGLGLNIVKKYVEMLNGTIDFESELGIGTIFYLTFPINQ